MYNFAECNEMHYRMFCVFIVALLGFAVGDAYFRYGILVSYSIT